MKVAAAVAALVAVASASMHVERPEPPVKNATTTEEYQTKTLYQTQTFTITQCPQTVTYCPASKIQTTVVTVRS